MLPKVAPYNRKEPEILRDRDYLDWLRDQPCILTGVGPCDPAHIGTAGKGIKSPDDEALPIACDLHRRMHQHGEMSIVRALIPNSVLRMALRALAREMYQEYKAGLGNADNNGGDGRPEISGTPAY